MITSVNFLSRQAFLDRSPQANEAVISIGDPDQVSPDLSAYQHNLRLQFLDLEDDCWKHGISVSLLFSPQQAETIVAFIKILESFPQKIATIVHCEAGVSRSAAVALSIQAYVNQTGVHHIELNNDASFANTRVIHQMEESLQISIPIPQQPFQNESMGQPLW